MIQWPAIIKLDGDAELFHIRDDGQWQKEKFSHATEYLDGDRLIDSKGNIYDLSKNNGDPADTGNRMTLGDLLGLIKAHLAEQGSCCVAKLGANSYKEAIELLVSPDYCDL